MRAPTRLFQLFLTDQSGATAIEYGVLIAGIALVLVTAIYSIGSKINDVFGLVASAINL